MSESESEMVVVCPCGAEVDGMDRLRCQQCGRDYIDIVTGSP